MRYQPEPEVAALLAPVRGALDQAAERLPVGPALLPVVLGEVETFWEVREDILVLDHHLAGPSLHHPEEGPLPLDRWRRSAGAVLEALAAAHLVALGVTEKPWWILRGAAVALAHRAWPELGLADSEIASARAWGDFTRHPRSGFAAYLHAGTDPIEQALAWTETLPDAEAFLDLARWTLETDHALPVPVGRASAVMPRIGAWRFAQLRLGGGPLGGRLAVNGDGAAHPAYAPADAEILVILASRKRASVSVTPAGPFGSWRFASARGFGELMGARGIDFAFDARGGVEILLADAFVGPLPALEFAEEVGTSGVVRGRWSLIGEDRLRFGELVPMGITVHGRKDLDFRMPAPGAGLESYLSRLEGSAWTWRVADNELLLEGDDLGAEMTLRFVKG